MKKLSTSLALVAVCILSIFGLSLPSAHAAGTFQLSNFNPVIYGISGEHLATVINFFYSGNNIPSVSIVGDPSVINSMQLGYVLYGANGYDSIVWSGTPAQTGSYPMTLTLTDNYGAFMTQPFTFNVFNQQITIATTTLPAGVVGSSYSASVGVNWWGNGTPNISFMGVLPTGISPVQGFESAFSGSLRGGTTTIGLSGTPSQAGQFPLMINATIGTSTATEQVMLDIASSSAPVAPQPVVIPPAQTVPTTTSQTSNTTVATSTAPQPTTYANVTQNLQAGTSGQNVINLQDFLIAKGFLTMPAGASEGYFGNLTKQALIQYQASVGLPATGYCGPMTRAMING